MVSKKKNDTFVPKMARSRIIFRNLRRFSEVASSMRRFRKGARVVEEARLESVYTSKAYQGFESPSFRVSNKWEKIK